MRLSATVTVDGQVVSRDALIRELARRLRTNPTPADLENAAHQLEMFLELEAKTQELLERALALVLP